MTVCVSCIVSCITCREKYFLEQWASHDMQYQMWPVHQNHRTFQPFSLDHCVHELNWSPPCFFIIVDCDHWLHVFCASRDEKHITKQENTVHHQNWPVAQVSLGVYLKSHTNVLRATYSISTYCILRTKLTIKYAITHRLFTLKYTQAVRLLCITLYDCIDHDITDPSYRWMKTV